MKNFKEMALTRQSCRRYDPARVVTSEQIAHVLETARLAPSACNAQPWHITVVSGDRAPEFAKSLQRMGMNKFTNDCPVFLVVNEEEMNRSAKVGGKLLGQHYASYDIGILVAHLCYAAMDEGLSTCIAGWFDEKKIKEQTGIAKNKKICLVVCLGYAADNDPQRPKQRKELRDIVTIL